VNQVASPFQGEGRVRVALKVPKPLTSVLSPWFKGRGNKGQCFGSKFVDVDRIIMPAVF